MSLFYNKQQLPQNQIKKPSGDPIEQGSTNCETCAKFRLLFYFEYEVLLGYNNTCSFATSKAENIYIQIYSQNLSTTNAEGLLEDHCIKRAYINIKGQLKVAWNDQRHKIGKTRSWEVSRKQKQKMMFIYHGRGLQYDLVQ